MTQTTPSTAFVGITGASGAPYALRLLRALAELGCRISLCISDSGLAVVRHELDLPRGDREDITDRLLDLAQATAVVYDPADMGAPASSGSSAPEATVVCPCSLSSAASIALGVTPTLIQRVGMVALKERRTLVLVPREMPLSSVHLRRLLEASEAGALIVPAAPGFYNRPRTLQDAVDHVVGKVLSLIGFKHEMYPAWDGERD